MIIEGKIINPSFIETPNIQPEPRGDDPTVFVRGQGISFRVKFPIGTKRLLFTISERVFSQEALFEQVVFPPKDEVGVAEFSVPEEKTFQWCAGLFHWSIFQLRDSGEREVWLPFNAGTFSLIDSPSTRTLVEDKAP